jgi:hypothetical protein
MEVISLLKINKNRHYLRTVLLGRRHAAIAVGFMLFTSVFLISSTVFSINNAYSITAIISPDPATATAQSPIKAQASVANADTGQAVYEGNSTSVTLDGSDTGIGGSLTNTASAPSTITSNTTHIQLPATTKSNNTGASAPISLGASNTNNILDNGNPLLSNNNISGTNNNKAQNSSIPTTTLVKSKLTANNSQAIIAPHLPRISNNDTNPRITTHTTTTTTTASKPSLGTASGNSNDTIGNSAISNYRNNGSKNNIASPGIATTSSIKPTTSNSHKLTTATTHATQQYYQYQEQQQKKPGPPPTSSLANAIPQPQYPSYPYPYQKQSPNAAGNQQHLITGQYQTGPPTANAGVSLTANENTTVILDGKASYDPTPSNSIVAYQWTQLHTGVSVTLAGANTATPTFSTPKVTADTPLAFSLRVIDNHGNISTNTAIVYVMVRHNNSNIPAVSNSINSINQPQKQQQPLLTPHSPIIPTQPAPPNTFYYPQQRLH